MQIGGGEIHDFLDTRPGIEHDGEERVIAPTLGGAAVDRGQHGLDLVVLQVLHRARAAPLEGDGEDALTLIQSVGTSTRKIGEEGVNGREANIARGRAVPAFVLQMLKESHDLLGIEVVDVQLNDGTGSAGGDEPEPEHEAVPIDERRLLLPVGDN